MVGNAICIHLYGGIDCNLIRCTKKIILIVAEFSTKRTNSSYYVQNRIGNIKIVNFIRLIN